MNSRSRYRNTSVERGMMLAYCCVYSEPNSPETIRFFDHIAKVHAWQGNLFPRDQTFVSMDNRKFIIYQAETEIYSASDAFFIEELTSFITTLLTTTEESFKTRIQFRANTYFRRRS